MSTVFIHDHSFLIDQNQKVFTSGTLDAAVWSRFTNNFGILTVIGRGIKLENECHDYKSACADNVTFDLFYQIRGGLDYLKYKKQIIQKLTSYILNTEYIVLRLPSIFGYIAAKLCKKNNKKYLVEVVGCAFDSLWYYGNISGKLLSLISYYNNKKAINNANAAIYVTENFLQKRYPNPNCQTYASNVEIENFDNQVLENHLKFLQRNNNQLKIIGMIGNVALPYKGFCVLFSALRNVEMNYQLHIVGGGDTTWITKLINKYGLKSKIILRGRISEKNEIYNFLDSLDIYIQPSLTEGLPRSVIEAMSRACPIIASNTGGIPELILSDAIYQKKNAKKLSSLITNILCDIDKLQNLSKENFERSKKYASEAINQRRYQFLKEITNKICN